MLSIRFPLPFHAGFSDSVFFSLFRKNHLHWLMRDLIFWGLKHAQALQSAFDPFQTYEIPSLKACSGSRAGRAPEYNQDVRRNRAAQPYNPD